MILYRINQIRLILMFIFAICVGQQFADADENRAGILDQIEPKILFITPLNGRPIYLNSAFYDVANETITMGGLFSDVKQELIDLGNVGIFVNGSNVPAAVALTGSRIVDGVTYRSGAFTQEVPVTFNDYWPMRQFVAEIVNTKNFETLARHQIALYDLRAHSDATPFESKDTEIYGMFSQLTDLGVGHKSNNDREFNLEKTLRSVLPYPSLEEFNAKLTSRAQSIPRYDNDSDLLRACVEYKDLEEQRFQDEEAFPAYDSALTEAKRQFRLYKIAKRACNGLATPALILACKIGVEATFCIKSKPEPDDFELCVDQIEGDVQSLELEEVSEVGLNFRNENSGDRGLLRSHISVSGVNGKVNAYLRSMSVEWRHHLCLARPKEPVDDMFIEQTRWLDKWATCKNIPVNSSSASTVTGDDPAIYQIRRDVDNRERPEVTLNSEGTFVFQGRHVNANRGICREPFIHTQAEAMADTFHEPLRVKFQNTWYSDSPNTMEAQALTELLEPYRLGEIEHPHYDIKANLETLGTAPETGLQIYWLNSLESDDTDTLFDQKLQWFHAEQRGIAFSDNARDHLGRKFDISYSINTGLLNQILNMRAATPESKLHKPLKPTWGDLAAFGVDLPAGASLDDKAVLNGRTMRQFDPAFISIGSKTLEIKIRPIFDPIVYMPPDPTAQTTIPDVGAPTTYGIESLEVTFKEKDRTVDGETVTGKTWLRLLGGFNDQEFNFAVRKKKGARFLKPNLVADNWQFNIVNNSLLGCRLEFMGLGGAGRIGACERRLERKVMQLIKAAFRDKFIELLSEVPAPIVFDVNGQSNKAAIFGDVNREQEGQRITFFGLFQ